MTHGGRKPISVTHPALAREADGWDPSTLTPGSNRRVKWKCHKGHHWTEVVYTRTQGSNCPYCGGKKVLPGFNDLKSRYPKLAKEAHGWDPSKKLPGGKHPLEWKCNKGHVWTATIYHRISRKGDCHYCNGKKALAGYNDLKTTHPEIARQAHGWDPRTVRPGSNKKMRWKCKQGHVWTMAIVNRTGQEQGCPICAGQRVLAGYNDLKTTHPEVAKEASGWDPTTVSKGSKKKLRWRCKQSHTWLAAPGMRTQGTGCPVCSGNVVLAGYNDLKTTHPEIARQAHGWDPRTVRPGSNKKMRWKCKLGHTWNAAVSNRSNLDSGCPICAGQEILVGFNDLQTTHPDLALEADGWNPTKVSRGQSKTVKWKGQCGHRWGAPISARTNKKYGCPYCSGKRVLKGFNDLLTTHPEIAKQAKDWDPSTLTNGSNASRQWICDLGHVWTSVVAARFDRGNQKGTGCPYCSGNKVLRGFNDLKTTHPDIASQAHQWDPRSVSKGVHTRKRWQCTEGHIWTAAVNVRVSGTGCPTCAKGGFDPNQEGWLYFLEHDEWDLFQVGITNLPKDRIADHLNNGWAVRDIRGPMDGHTTRELETEILRLVRASGGVMANKTDRRRFDGWTESWERLSYPTTSLRQLIDEVMRVTD